MLDEWGLLTGRTCTREEAHSLGLWHRTAHVWIAGPNRTLLLQKRSPDKDAYPGCWDISSAGHLDAGEEPLPGALRELREELGLDASPEMLEMIGTVKSDRESFPRGKRFIDREFAHVFLMKVPSLPALTLQKTEVAEVKWFPAGECLRAAEENDPAFCLLPGEVRLVSSALS